MAVFINREDEKKDLIDSFKKTIIKNHSTLGVVIRGRYGIGKTALVNQFFKNIEEVDILANLPKFSLEKNVIRYTCQKDNQFKPYQAFIEITKEINENKKVWNVILSFTKIILSVFGINDVLNALNNFAQEVYTHSEDSSKKEAKIFNNYRNYLKRKSSNSPIIIYFQHVQWIDMYSLKLINNLLEYETLWGMIILEEDDEDTNQKNYSFISNLVLKKYLFKIELGSLNRDFPRMLLNDKFGNDFITNEENEILYVISEGCPGKLLSYINNTCIDNKWIYEENGQWKKVNGFKEKIKPANQKLIELVLSLYEDKVLDPGEIRLIEKMATTWGIEIETVRETVNMIKDIVDKGYKISYNLGYGIISPVSFFATSSDGRQFVVEYVELNNNSKISTNISESGVNHSNLMKTHDVLFAEHGLIVVWDYFERKEQLEAFENHVKSTLTKYYELAKGLSEIHLNDMYHGYLRPHTIIEKTDGSIQLATLNSQIVKVLYQNSVFNNNEDFYYISPEQLSGSAGDKRSDIFSFGVLLYHSLVRNYPFLTNDKNGLHKLYKENLMKGGEIISFDQTFSDFIPKGVKKLLVKCLQLNPDKRFQDANELIKELADLIKELEYSKPGSKELNEYNRLKKEPESKNIKVNSKQLRKGVIFFLIAAVIIISYFLLKNNKDTFTEKPLNKIIKNEIVINVSSHGQSSNKSVLDSNIIYFLLAKELKLSGDMVVLTPQQFKKIYPNTSSNQYLPKKLVKASVQNLDFNYSLDVSVDDNKLNKHTEKIFDFNDPSELLSDKIYEIINFILPSVSNNRKNSITDDWDAFTYYYKGWSDWQKVNKTEAFKNFNYALTIDSGFTLARLRLSEIYRFDGSNTLASKNISKVINSISDLSTADSLKALAIRNLLNGQNRVAIKLLREIIANQPANKESYFNLAEAYFDVRDIEKAKRNYQLALKFDPDYIPAINHLAYCYSHLGEHTKALEYFRKYLELDSSANAYDSYGDGLMTAGLLDSAAWTKNQGLKIDPDLDYLYSSLNFIQVRLLEFNKAEESINKYIYFKTNAEQLTEGYTNKALIYFQMGDDVKALDTCLKAQNIFHSDNLLERNHKMHWLLFQLYIRNNKEMAMIELNKMESLIQKNNINATNYNEILKYYLHCKAVLYKENNDFDELNKIISVFDQDIKYKIKDWNSPHDYAYFSMQFADLLKQMGYDSLALKQIEKAKSYSPYLADPDVLLTVSQQADFKK